MSNSRARPRWHAALAAALFLVLAAPVAAYHGWPTVVTPRVHPYGGHGYGHGIVHRHPHHYLPRSHYGTVRPGLHFGAAPRYRHFGHRFGHRSHKRRHHDYFHRHHYARPHRGSSLYFLYRD